MIRFWHEHFLALSGALLLLASAVAALYLLRSDSKAPPALNLGFEQVVDTAGTPRYWRTSRRWHDVRADTSVSRSGERSLLIRSIGRREAEQPGVAGWGLPGEPTRGKPVRLEGWIRTDEAARSSRAHLVLRASGPGSVPLAADTATLAAHATGKTPPRGADSQNASSEGWQRYAAELDVPPEAEQVSFWAELSGRGRAWFDDLSLRIGGEPYDPPPAFRASEGEVAWVRSEAVPFKTTDPTRGLGDLAPVAEIVGETRIAGLGEGTHGTREFFRVKHRLTKLLAKEGGFTVFAVEANMPEARRVNRYVQTGQGDPREAIEGLRFWTVGTESMLALVEWMRAYNASGKGRVAFWGFDMQFPEVAMDSVHSFAERYGASGYADSVAATYGEVRDALRQFGRIPGQSGRAAYAAWHRKARSVENHLKARRRAYRQAGADSSAVAWAVQNARIVRQAAAARLPDQPSRDESMARNVEWILGHAGPEAGPNPKAVLWAHNAHVEESRSGSRMGYHLAERYGDEYLAVGFAFHVGRYTAVGSEGLGPYRAAPSEPGSIEHVFHRTGLKRFALDLRAGQGGSVPPRWLRRRVLHRQVGALAQPWAFTPFVPAEAYDMVFYIEESTPSRGL